MCLPPRRGSCRLASSNTFLLPPSSVPSFLLPTPNCPRETQPRARVRARDPFLSLTFLAQGPRVPPLILPWGPELPIRTLYSLTRERTIPDSLFFLGVHRTGLKVLDFRFGELEVSLHSHPRPAVWGVPESQLWLANGTRSPSKALSESNLLLLNFSW